MLYKRFVDNGEQCRGESLHCTLAAVEVPAHEGVAGNALTVQQQVIVIPQSHATVVVALFRVQRS